MKKITYLAIFLAATLSACKKDKKNTTGTATLNQLKDSVFYYEKEDYLWNTAIPSYNSFDPDSYAGSSDMDALSNELFAISQLKVNPTTGLPYEYYPYDPQEAKYSFMDDGTTTASLNGTNGDFGFEPIWDLYDGNNDIRIKYVYPNSPAGLAGLQRGDQITAVNGSSDDLTYDDGADVNKLIQEVYYSKTITLTVKNLAGNSQTVTLATASYTVDPVITYKVFNEGNGHEVGYLVFNSFTSLTNAQPKLDEAFNYFIAQGVNDLVVDMRYNGGGEGQTAEYLDDLIVPPAKTGTLMYTQYFNAGLQADQYPLLAKKYALTAGEFLPANNQSKFNKALTLGLTRVFFIVTGSTASSSELTINNLRPEMDVELVGDTTYGKPVGEIPIPINKYIMYSPQLTVENSAKQGDYYAGMAPVRQIIPEHLPRMM